MIQEVQIASSHCTNVTITIAYQQLVCRLPRGFGLLVTLILSITTFNAVPIESQEYSLLGYSPPSLSTVSHADCSPAAVAATSISNCPRTGGGWLDIEGDNLGYTGAVVLIGDSVCTNLQHDPNRPDSKVQCELPTGSAVEASVVLIQSGGAIAQVGNVTVVSSV